MVCTKKRDYTINWTTPTQAIDASGLSSTPPKWRKVVYGNNMYLALSEMYCYLSKSIDGKTWTNPFVYYNSSDNRYVYSYDLIFDGSKFIILTYNANTGKLIIFTSTNGENWTNISEKSTSSFFPKVIIFDGEKYIAIDTASRYVFTSTDLSNWSVGQRMTGILSSVTLSANFIYDGTKIITIGSNKALYTSVNSGITWTATHSTNLENVANWRALTYDGQKYLAINGDGYISKSDDGIVWGVPVRTLNLTISGSWVSLAFDNKSNLALSTHDPTTFKNYVSLQNIVTIRKFKLTTKKNNVTKKYILTTKKNNVIKRYV